MLREEFLKTSRAFSNARPIMRMRAEALGEVRRACGRFRSVASTEETLRTFIAEKAADIDTLGDPLFLGNDTPLNWQRLLAYLHEQKVIAAPRFAMRQYRNDYPKLFQFFELAPLKDSAVSDGHGTNYSGFGGSFDREVAMSKAVGEALERYFLCTYKRDALRVSSYADLARRVNTLDIRQFDLFLDWQKKRFPRLSFDEKSMLRWVRGREFLTGKSIYLPAQMVFWTYDHAPSGQEPEKMLMLQTTSGSAGHFTRDEAALAALLEAIQRDAFLIYWLNSLSPKIIDIDTVEDQQIRNFVAELLRFNLEPIFLNTTSDFAIPMATCVVIDKSDPENPIFSIGSSAGFTLEDTLMSSGIEAVAVQQFVSLNEQHVLPEKYQPFTDVKLGRSERLFSWRGKKMAERFKFFISGKKQSSQEFIGNAPEIDTVQKQLAHVVAECAAKGEGYEIYTYEVKNKILDTLGYHVVRAIVPELVPLYLVESTAPLKARRLHQVPPKIGYTTAKEFNRWPHPFP